MPTPPESAANGFCRVKVSLETLGTSRIDTLTTRGSVGTVYS